jgi:signal transduction histidine kinase
LSGASRLILLIPWLLFLGLGLSMARLLYEAWQEQSALEALADKIRQERELLEQKRNFVRLSSHYLRTPLTLITTGVELMAGRGADPVMVSRLQWIGKRLNLGVNGMLEQASPQLAGGGRSKQKLPNLTLYLASSLAGAFIVIASAVYLLGHLDLSDFKLNSLLAESVVVLLAAVVVYSVWRTRAARRLVKAHFEELLNEQRALDRERNLIVKGTLDNLTTPLEELKSIVKPVANEPMAHPVMEGLRSFESILRRFVILSSLETGSMATQPASLSLKQMVARIAQRYSAQIKQKQLQIRTELKADQLEQDPLLLEFVMNSLIDNAIQYSPSGKFVDIISRKSGKDTLIFVRDGGVGIPRDKLNQLFKPFSRVEDVEQQFEHQGIGLSLYLDRLIMRYLGGEIAANSLQGQGTTIKLRLPATQPYKSADAD